MEFGWINLLGTGALLLRHWLLVAFAVFFGFAHCTITYLTHKGC